MEKCFFCKGEMTADTCNYMADLDGHFIIIKGVPCHKCIQCGEVSFAGATAAQIEMLTEQLKEKHIEIAVINYAA